MSECTANLSNGKTLNTLYYVKNNIFAPIFISIFFYFDVQICATHGHIYMILLYTSLCMFHTHLCDFLKTTSLKKMTGARTAVDMM